ncbi:hypothetical protein D3C83_71790 [compost metagenome]
MLGILTPLEVLNLELRALRLEQLLVVVGGAQRLLLRQQEVAREARLHLDDVAHLPERLDTFQKDHIHGSNSNLRPSRPRVIR